MRLATTDPEEIERVRNQIIQEVYMHNASASPFIVGFSGAFYHEGTSVYNIVAIERVPLSTTNPDDLAPLSFSQFKFSSNT